MKTTPIASHCRRLCFRATERPRRLTRAVAATLSLVLPAANAEPPGGDHPAVEVKFIRVESADVTVVAGRLIAFSLDDGLLLEEPDKPGAPHWHVAASDLVLVATHDASEVPSSGMARVILTNGDRVIGTPGQFADGAVVMESPSLGAIRVPLEDVTRWINPPADGLAIVGDETAPDDVTTTTDRLLLQNGDTVEGIVRSVDREAFVLETPDGVLTIAYDRVSAALILSAVPPPATQLRARITFPDGTRLTTDAFDWSNGRAEMTLLGHPGRAIPGAHNRAQNIAPPPARRRGQRRIRGAV